MSEEDKHNQGSGPATQNENVNRDTSNLKAPPPDDSHPHLLGATLENAEENTEQLENNPSVIDKDLEKNTGKR